MIWSTHFEETSCTVRRGVRLLKWFHHGTTITFGHGRSALPNLWTLIDLGWSDYRIASYFSVEPKKVSALRVYYGLVQQAPDSWVWRMRRRKRLAYER
jgi:hypothetical protein